MSPKMIATLLFVDSMAACFLYKLYQSKAPACSLYMYITWRKFIQCPRRKNHRLHVHHKPYIKVSNTVYIIQKHSAEFIHKWILVFLTKICMCFYSMNENSNIIHVYVIQGNLNHWEPTIDILQGQRTKVTYQVCKNTSFLIRYD